MLIHEFLQTVHNKHKRFFTAAYAVALTSSGVGGRNRNTFRLGCVLVDGSSIVASGINSYKTHPATLHYGEYPFLHAEQEAIFRRGLDNTGGASLYIVRVRRDGQVGSAKPCTVCELVIKDANIKRVWNT